MTTTDFGASVRLERADPIATIVIDNPAKRNAVDRAVATALRATAGAARFAAGAGRHGAGAQ